MAVQTQQYRGETIQSKAEPSVVNTASKMTVEQDTCFGTVETLPDKSKSLRRSSVQKRLETEMGRSQPKVREKISKKYRLSKYRSKMENAKKGEWTKKFNKALNNLRKILPNNELVDQNNESEKDMKVNNHDNNKEYSFPDVIIKHLMKLYIFRCHL